MHGCLTIGSASAVKFPTRVVGVVILGVRRWHSGRLTLAVKMSRKVLVCVDKSSPAVYTAQWAFENVIKPEDDVILLSAVKVRFLFIATSGERF